MKYGLAPDFVCVPTEECGTCIIRSGQGSRRHELEINSQKLLRCLLELRVPKARPEIVDLVAASISIDGKDAQLLVDQFIELNFLVQDQQVVSPFESSRMWSTLGWRDALDFHLATRNMVWQHSYKSDEEKPPIMTYRWDGSFIQPDRPRPKRTTVSTSKICELPPLSQSILTKSYFDTLSRRRTCRRFISKPLFIADVSDTLGLALRVHFMNAGRPYRAAPTYSLGSFFSIYALLSNVKDIVPGVYWYDDLAHQLGLIEEMECSDLIKSIAQEQPFIKNAGAALLVTVNWEQYMWKYRFGRAYRLAIFEISSLVQTLLLSATAAGLATFLSPAIDDLLAVRTCKISNPLLQTPLYIVGLGQPTSDALEHIDEDVQYI